MNEITRYGDVGTAQRHQKFGGVKVTIIDGQPISVAGATDYLDAFLLAKVFNQEQYDSVYQLIRDYQIGFLYKWRTVKEYLRSAGLSAEDAEKQREEARLNFNAAIRYNCEFIKLANIAHLLLEQIGVYIPAPWRLKQLADRLIRYYNTHTRIELDLP